MGVTDDLVGCDGAAVDGEEFAFGRDEEAGGDREGCPEIEDGGLEGVEHFDRLWGGHFGREVCLNRFQKGVA